MGGCNSRVGSHGDKRWKGDAGAKNGLLSMEPSHVEFKSIRPEAAGMQYTEPLTSRCRCPAGTEGGDGDAVTV